MSRTRWSYREEVSKHLLASIEESREQNLKLLAPEPPKVEFYDPRIRQLQRSGADGAHDGGPASQVGWRTPSAMFFVGAVDPARYKVKPTMKTAIVTETTVLRELMGKPGGVVRSQSLRFDCTPMSRLPAGQL
jgi:hypothetical protein